MTTETRMEDYKYAVNYVRATQRALDRGIEWKLTFAQYKAIRKRKKCFYTGITMTPPPPTQTKGEIHPPTMVTIDRIDHRKGYEMGNVVACCYYANLAKAQLENPGFLPELGLGLDAVEKMRILFTIMQKLKDVDFL